MTAQILIAAAETSWSDVALLAVGLGGMALLLWIIDR